MAQSNKIYEDIITRIIENGIILYGNLAIAIARKITGLEVSINGEVLNITGSPDKVLNNLITEYNKLDESISSNSIKNIISVYEALNPNLNITQWNPPD